MTATITGPVSFVPLDSVTTIEVLDPDLTLIGEVPFVAQTARVDDAVSATGILEVHVGLDEPIAEGVDAVDALVDGNLLRLKIDGLPVLRAEIEAPIKRQLAHVDGDARLVATLSCRGDVAQLENVPVLPYGGVGGRPQATSRPFSWCSPEADTSGLDPATVTFSELAVPAGDLFSPWFPPKGYPDPTTKHLWASAPHVTDGHPVQTRRFVRDITIEDEGWYHFWGFADDGLRVFMDGLFCIEGAEDPGDSFIEPVHFPIYLTEGVHRLGIEAYNYWRPTNPDVIVYGGQNIARIGWSLYYLPQGNETLLTDDLLIAHSDESTLTVDTDAGPPAPTWGKIIETLFDEAPAGSPASSWTLDFSDTVDSNGDAWTLCGDQSFSDASILSVLQQGAASGCIDWHADPDTRVLYVTNFGAMGAEHAASYTTENGQLVDMQETTIAGRVSGLVVRYDKGQFILDDPTTETAIGARRKPLALADLPEEAARAEAQRELDIRKQARSSYTAAIECTAGTSDAPYGIGGWTPGDSPLFNSERLRAMRVSTTFDLAGNPTFVPELETRLQGEAERQAIALSKAGATLDGTSRAATPIEGMTSGIVAGFAKTIEPIVFTQVMLTPDGMEAVYDTSNSRKWEGVNIARIYRIDLKQDVAPQSVDTVCKLYKLSLSGTTLLETLTLPVGDLRVTVLPEYLHLTQLEEIYMVVDQHDTAVNDPDDPVADARWLRLEVQAIDANPAAVRPRQVEVPW